MITPSGRILYRPVMTSVGLLNSGDPRVRFGPGTDSKAAFIEVRGPSGIVQTLTDLAADQAPQDRGAPKMTSHDNRQSKQHCSFLTRRQLIRGNLAVAASLLLPKRGFSLFPNSSLTSCNPAISQKPSIHPQAKSAVVRGPITFENAARQSGVTFVLDNSASPHRFQPETAI